MEFTCEIGDTHKAQLEFIRSSFSGGVRIKVDGVVVYRVSPLNPLAHIGVSQTRRYEFVVDGVERLEVAIEKRRPLALAAFRTNEYRVFVNGKKAGVFLG